MTSPENQNHGVNGEADPRRRDEIIQGLGEAGLNILPIAPEDMIPAHDAAPNTVEEYALPYRLSEITSRSQYLSDEHAEEFWSVYRREATRLGQSIGRKHQNLFSGLTHLTRPLPVGGDLAHLTDDQVPEYARRLGLEVVVPRTEVGFPAKLVPGSYGTFHASHGESLVVVRVGSFVDFAERADDLLTERRIYGVGRPQIRFFKALAAHLRTQLSS